MSRHVSSQRHPNSPCVHRPTGIAGTPTPNTPDASVDKLQPLLAFLQHHPYGSEPETWKRAVQVSSLYTKLTMWYGWHAAAVQQSTRNLEAGGAGGWVQWQRAGGLCEQHPKRSAQARWRTL